MPQEENPTTSIDSLTVGELISLADAAKLSGFGASYLRKAAETKRLKAKKIARNWLTTMAAVEEYKNSRVHKLRKDIS